MNLLPIYAQPVRRNAMQGSTRRGNNANSIQSANVPGCYRNNGCGRWEGDRPCSIFECLPSCSQGMVENLLTGQCYHP